MALVSLVAHLMRLAASCLLELPHGAGFCKRPITYYQFSPPSSLRDGRHFFCQPTAAGDLDPSARRSPVPSASSVPATGTVTKNVTVSSPGGTLKFTRGNIGVIRVHQEERKSEIPQ